MAFLRRMNQVHFPMDSHSFSATVRKAKLQPERLEMWHQDRRYSLGTQGPIAA